MVDAVPTALPLTLCRRLKAVGVSLHAGLACCGPNMYYADGTYADGAYLVVGLTYADGYLVYAYGRLRRRQPSAQRTPTAIEPMPTAFSRRRTALFL